MSFHENLIQTFQNFKDVFIGSTDISSIGDGKLSGAISALDSEKQDTLTAGDNITIDANGRISATGTDIDDTVTSTVTTWSSNKINVEFQNKQDTLTAGDNITIDSNGTISATGGVSDLADLTDVVIVSATNGQIIKYNTTSGKWENVDYIDDTSSNANVVWSASKIVSELATKQGTLTAGAGITITNNTISANAGISLTVVQTLPTTDISTNTIYLVPKTTAGTNDVYDEWVYVNNSWEHIGSTEVDLTSYYTKTEINGLLNDKQDSLSVSNNGLNLTNNTLSMKLHSSLKFSSSGNLMANYAILASNDNATKLNRPLFYSRKVYYPSSGSTYNGISISNSSSGAYVLEGTADENGFSKMIINSLDLPSGSYSLFFESSEALSSNIFLTVEVTDGNSAQPVIYTINNGNANVTISYPISLNNNESTIKVYANVASNYEISGQWFIEWITLLNKDFLTPDLTNYYTSSEVDSLFTSLSTSQSEVDSTQNASISSLASVSTSQTSQITSMSTSLSELATTASSLTTAQSEQAVTISSLSTDTSELGSEVTILSSEVADKQDVLTAGQGIEIQTLGNNTVIKTTGATIYASALYPEES